MAQPQQPRRGEDNSDEADAAFLFQDETPGRPPAPPPSSQPSPASTGDEYGLAGGLPEVDETEPVPPVPIPPPVPRPRPAAEQKARAGPAREARVDQVWSRGAEWGPNLLLLAVVALVIAGLFYVNLSGNKLGLLAVILLAGGAVLLVLSYPILITLERPVRMTPEQAVRDFYNAASHALPHYRRMWLLLSSAGRESPEFHSFPEFKAYWKRRLAQLRAKGQGGGFTPLLFEIQSFKSEKSAGQTAIDGSYTVDVHLQGKKGDTPLESVRINTDFVRGPDRMWYLNDGTLPD